MRLNEQLTLEEQKEYVRRLRYGVLVWQTLSSRQKQNVLDDLWCELS